MQYSFAILRDRPDSTLTGSFLAAMDLNTDQQGAPDKSNARFTNVDMPGRPQEVENRDNFQPRPTSRLRRRWSYCRMALLRNTDHYGIRRIDPDNRCKHRQLTVGVVLEFWFGCNCSTLNIIVGMLGPLKFALSQEEATIVSVAAITLGCVPVAFIASLGPASGLRTMVINRFVVGWYPAKAMSGLVALIVMGFATLETIAAGDTISQLLPNLPAAAIVAVTFAGIASVVTAVLGSNALEILERWAWRPQLLALCVLLGAVVPRLGGAAPSAVTAAVPVVQLRDWVGFFNIVFSSTVSFSTIAADFFAHYPEETPRWRLVVGTFVGLWVSFTLTIGVGITLAAVGSRHPSWRSAYNTSPAALLVTAFEPLGTLGKICCVVLALGNSAAAAAGIFSQALAGQHVSAFTSRLSRAVWTATTGCVVLLCAVAGRSSLSVSLQSFVSVVGSWTAVWLTVFVLEFVVVQRRRWRWQAWDSRAHLPRGVATTTAMVIGVLIATLSTVQPWFVGPISRLVDSKGIEVRTWPLST